MMDARPRLRRSALPAQAGFTLIEILVALAVGTVILLALAILFSRTSGNQAELERSTRQLENARFALDELTENLLHAGYFGDFDPDSMAFTPTYTTPTPCITKVDDLEWVTPNAGAVSLPAPVQGLESGTAIGCGLAGTNRQADTQALIVRHADTGAALTPVAPSVTLPLTAGNLYVQVSRCTLDVQRILVGSVEADFTLRMPNCITGATDINRMVRRVVQRTYYIADCSDCAAADGIPTLRRLEWIDGQLRDTPLAEGIENMQFEFGVDTDDDGQADQNLGADKIIGPAPLVWNNVVSVRVHLLARSTQATAGYVDTRTYQMGDVSVTPGDAFKHTLLTSTVRLMNVGGRRE
jgi:type IV pilus assembly protein PilW